MDIAIGLPSTLRVKGTDVVEWARRAEERGFSSLAAIDRIVYPSYDALTTLAAVAGVTSRIRLFTDILLTPLYPPVWLAKATASLDALSGGRLTLGLGVGNRPDDFVAMDRPLERRGELMDEMLDLLRRAWAGEIVIGDEHPVGPEPAAGNRIPVLIGGTSDAAVRRTVSYGEGWTAGGARPDAMVPMIEKVRQGWREAGREGEPRIGALVYFGLGEPEVSMASLRHYYSFLQDGGEAVAQSALRSPDAIRAKVRAFAGVGVTELVFNPTVPSVEEVDRLADAVL